MHFPLNAPLPDPEIQLNELAQQILALLRTDTLMVGILSGGAWLCDSLSRRIHSLTGTSIETGSLNVSFHRDDFQDIGLHHQSLPTHIPSSIDGRSVLLIDDVLFTGRTTRAAINELFDYGRPASIQLAVLADRGGRELPITPNACVWTLELPSKQNLALSRSQEGNLIWTFEEKE